MRSRELCHHLPCLCQSLIFHVLRTDTLGMQLYAICVYVFYEGRLPRSKTPGSPDVMQANGAMERYEMTLPKNDPGCQAKARHRVRGACCSPCAP